MNIVVTIHTKHGEASKSVAFGYVALLNAVLDTVDRMRLLVELNSQHGPDSATYLEALFPELGKVLDVKFVVPATAAAGEDEGVEETSPGPVKIRAAVPHPYEDGWGFALMTPGGNFVKKCGKYDASLTGDAKEAARFPTTADAFFAVEHCEALIWSKRLR